MISCLLSAMLREKEDGERIEVERLRAYADGAPDPKLSSVLSSVGASDKKREVVKILVRK